MAMEYLHSHVYTEINDNSIQTTVSDGGTVGLFAIFSDKGKENELVLIDEGVNQYYNTYGVDGGRFGQCQLNALQWLKGGGTAYVMRLLPDDATFASTGLIVNVDSYIPTYKLSISLETKKDDGSKLILGKQDYLVTEKLIFDASTIKEFALYNFKGGLEADAVGVFRTGRGPRAEDPYIESEDWMRKAGHATVENQIIDGEAKEVVTSYADYSLISDSERFLAALRQGTKVLSPGATESLMAGLNKIEALKDKIPLTIDIDGASDLLVLPKETVYFMVIDNKGNYKFYQDAEKKNEVPEKDVKLAVIKANSYSTTEPFYVYRTDSFVEEYTEAATPEYPAEKYHTVRRTYAGKDKDGNKQYNYSDTWIDKDGKTGSVTPFGEAEFLELVRNEIIDEEVGTDESRTRYVPGTEDVYVIVSNGQLAFNENSKFFRRVYSPLKAGETESFEPHKLVATGSVLNLVYNGDKKGLFNRIADGDFIDDGGADAKSSNNVMTLKSEFCDPELINVYYSFADCSLDDYALIDLFNCEVKDLAVDAQYFIDGNPIEVFSKPAASKISESGKIWNARFTVTDSDGNTTTKVIFRDVIKASTDSQAFPEGGPWQGKGKSGPVESLAGKAIFTQEAYVYAALNALCNGFKIYEPLRGPAFLEVKGGWYDKKTTVTDKTDPYRTAPFYLIDKAYNEEEATAKGLGGQQFYAVQWLNKDDLSSAVYSGSKVFTRKNADKVKVELYSPSRIASKTVDGIKLDIYDYCNAFNTNSSMILAGKKKYPVGYFVSSNKGDYYNNIKIYLTLNDNLKDTYDFRLYDLSIYDTANNKTKLIDGPFTVSFDKNAIDLGGASMYIKNILDIYSAKDANGMPTVQFFDDICGTDDILADLNEDLASLFRRNHPQYVFNNSAVDAFFIPKVDENVISQGNPDFEFHSYYATTDDESIDEAARTLRIQGDNNISTADSADLGAGFFLKNGYCGTLFDKRGTLIESVKTRLLTQAFTGGINKHVADTKNYEIDVIMDAGYSTAAKIAMVQLAESLRKDCIAVLDTKGILAPNAPATSVSAAIQARKSIGTSSYYASFWCQNTTAYDEYTAKDVPVASTYLLSYKIPFNDKNNGIQTSFVGPRRGTVDLYKALDWYPSEAEKEKLYKAQINYISKDPKRIAFDNQLTSQTVTSALSNIPNVRVLLKIKRAITKICDEYRFERNNGTTRGDMEAACNEYLKTWVNNGACETAKASVSATDYQIKQKIAQVAIDLVFVGFLERIHVVINING